MTPAPALVEDAICEIKPRVVCSFGKDWQNSDFFRNVTDFEEVYIGLLNSGDPSSFTADELPARATLLRSTKERNLFAANNDSYTVFRFVDPCDHADKDHVVLQLCMEWPRQKQQ